MGCGGGFVRRLEGSIYMQKELAGEGWLDRLLDLVQGCFQTVKGERSDEHICI